MTKNSLSTVRLSYDQPSPEEVRALREEFGLSQYQAAELLDVKVTYKEINGYANQQSATWQRYEATPKGNEGSSGSSSARAMPGLTWAMFQLITNRHPDWKLVKR